MRHWLHNGLPIKEYVPDSEFTGNTVVMRLDDYIEMIEETRPDHWLTYLENFAG